MKRNFDISGQRIGRLIVIERTKKTKTGAYFWLCKCDCGKLKEIRRSSLSHGRTVSCGCYSRQNPKNRLPGNEGAFNQCYSSMKLNAKRRGYIFKISKKQFKILTQKNCYYCNALPLQEMKTYKNTPSYFYNGLDRIDNNKGYTLKNVLTACGRCNKLRGTELSVEETKLLIKTLLDFRKKNENK